MLLLPHAQKGVRHHRDARHHRQYRRIRLVSQLQFRIKHFSNEKVTISTNFRNYLVGQFVFDSSSF